MNLVDPSLAMIVLLGFGCASAGSSGAPRDEPAVVVTDLRCEYLEEPLGLDVARPRLGWKLRAVDPRARGLRQTAYRILVASTPERLARDEGDLWDSGRVASSRTTFVEWGGVPLGARTECHWKVRSWTDDGAPSAWSAPARWTMGLLAPSDWSARWIGAARRAGPFEGANWIWYPEGDPAAGVPGGGRLFRRDVEIPAGRRVVRAVIRISADNLFALLVNGVEVATGERWEEPVLVDLAAVLRPGVNALAVGAVNAGEHPTPAGVIARLEIELDGGEEFVVVTDANWRAGKERFEGWESAAPGETAWPPARVLGPYGMEPWGSVAQESFGPDPWLRRSFTLEEGWKRAFAYVASLGYHEFWVNGVRIGDGVLAPAVSDLSRRARYVTYELTGHLRPGRNTLALWLGGGWSRFPAFGVTDGPLVLAQVEVTRADGTARRIVTDAAWKVHPSSATLLGAWRFGRFGGERVDARAEVADWNQPGFDDAGWAAATQYAPAVRVTAEKIEPNRRVTTILPAGLETIAPDAYRIDMGRGFTGWIEIPLRGVPGTTATMTVSERADEEITYDQRHEYVFDASGAGVFRNRFNYFSGRWITVRGVTAPPPLAEVRGYLVRTAFHRTASFACSDELLNRIYETALWTYECLCLGGFVVDCPHRERRGYGGDAHATMETALANFDQGAFYTKWLEDWRDVQGEDGNIPYTAPTYEGGGGPAWSGVCIALPWEVYLTYGDRRILAANYPMMKCWLAFLETRSRNGILHRFGHEDWGFLGDWVPPGRQQSRAERVDDRSTLFFNNCYRVQSIARVAAIAAVLGEEGDAERFGAQAEALRARVHEEFFDPATNTYVNGEQPYLALALLAGVTPVEKREAVMANLEREILVEHDGHVDAGIHGTYFLLKYLTESGRSDLVHSMVSQTSYPSWGYMLGNGATTFWEQWDAIHSRCHSSFLSVGAWLLEGLAGLRADPVHPGFARFHVRPAVVGNLTRVSARYDSIHGPIRVAWRREGARFRLELDVPPNTTALVHLPAEDPGAVREGGVSAEDAVGVRTVRGAVGEAILEVLSGSYSFTCTLPSAHRS